MAQNEPESCGNCRYSDPRVSDDLEPYLRCRRHPPVMILDGRSVISSFAQTDAEEWCGEWSEEPPFNPPEN